VRRPQNEDAIHEPLDGAFGTIAPYVRAIMVEL